MKNKKIIPMMAVLMCLTGCGSNSSGDSTNLKDEATEFLSKIIYNNLATDGVNDSFTLVRNVVGYGKFTAYYTCDDGYSNADYMSISSDGKTCLVNPPSDSSEIGGEEFLKATLTAHAIEFDKDNAEDLATKTFNVRINIVDGTLKTVDEVKEWNETSSSLVNLEKNVTFEGYVSGYQGTSLTVSNPLTGSSLYCYSPTVESGVSLGSHVKVVGTLTTYYSNSQMDKGATISKIDDETASLTYKEVDYEGFQALIPGKNSNDLIKVKVDVKEDFSSVLSGTYDSSSDKKLYNCVFSGTDEVCNIYIKKYLTKDQFTSLYNDLKDIKSGDTIYISSFMGFYVSGSSITRQIAYDYGTTISKE